jgi:hypothetical protein
LIVAALPAAAQLSARTDLSAGGRYVWHGLSRAAGLVAQLGGAAEWPVAAGDVALHPRVEVVVVDAARTVVSWDDDPLLELRLRSRRGGLAWWELRWSGVSAPRYRIRIPGERATVIP